MKKYLSLISVSLLLFACNNRDSPAQQPEGVMDDVDTLKQSYQFNGVFEGTIPCADCPGIETTVEFTPDQRFYEHMNYLERTSSFADSGTWVQKDSIITVDFGKQSQDRYFGIVNDSTISMLDAERNKITGPLADLYLLRRKDTIIHR